MKSATLTTEAATQNTDSNSTDSSLQSSPVTSKYGTPDCDLENEVANQGFERFRESIQQVNTTEKDALAEYCAKSLYSYSFTPVSRINRAAKAKKNALNREMDHMQRIRWRAGESESSRRFSQPNIGALNKSEWRNNWGSSELVKSPSMQNGPVKLLEDEEEVCYPTSSTPTSPNKDETFWSDPSQIVDLDPYHNRGRRQTIQIDPTDNNMPPIYEVTPEPNIPPACVAQYNRALHAPSRYLPQNQVILTTDVEGTVLLFNDMASLCFGIDKSYVGKSILDVLEEPFRAKITNLLARRKNPASNPHLQLLKGEKLKKGHVLMYGVVVPIRKISGESSAASLWLKEKSTDLEKCIYIWIFEEIYETSVSTAIDSKGAITDVIGTTKDLFGYKAENLIGKSITILIPGLSNGNISSPGVNLQKLKETKFYGGRSLKGISFPTMVHIQYQKTKESQDIQFPLLIKVVSLPSIAGLITVHHTGMIQSINPVPAKYLFGYSTERLVEKVNIDQLIPQFSEIVIGLRRNNLLQYSCTVNTHACRWVISDLCTTVSAKKLHNNGVNKSLKELERTPSISSSGQKLPMLYAVHRDGSNFEVQLQLRLLESKEEDMISIWVTYDRVHALRRSTKRKTPADKTKSTYPANVAQKEETQLHTNIMFNDQQESIPLVLSPHTQETKDSKRPPIKSYGISSFGSVNYERRIYSDKSPETNTSTGVSGSRIESTNNVQNKPGPMDAYVIMETLGEGAYGTAKLAYRKDDPAKTKVVIKFIEKSKIIIDSWIRDRKLGLIPLEIHILRKLAEYPHINCCSLESYAEDEDKYYVIMKLYGESMDLFDYIELNEDTNEHEVKSIFKQVVSAIHHIHELRIVHRDIKDENILLDETGCVHLIDFGSAAYFRKGRTFDTFGGTLEYCAPEVLKGKSYEGPPQDIWASGILLFTLIYRENPFYNIDEIMERDLRVPYILSEDSLDLIKRMLERDVEKRITIEQVLAHPWLQSM